MEVAGKTWATASARNLNRKSRALRSRATQQVTPDVVGTPVLGDETMAFVALLRQRRADLRSASLLWSQVDKDLTVIDLRVKLRALNGVAGTGKTLLALACGLQMTLDDERYNKLLVSRPIFPMGKDLGFLPGDLETKLVAANELQKTPKVVFYFYFIFYLLIIFFSLYILLGHGRP